MEIINGHKVSEVICLFCKHRWLAARPINTRLVELECPCCKAKGFAIETGEMFTAEDLLTLQGGEME